MGVLYLLVSLRIKKKKILKIFLLVYELSPFQLIYFSCWLIWISSMLETLLKCLVFFVLLFIFKRSPQNADWKPWWPGPDCLPGGFSSGQRGRAPTFPWGTLRCQDARCSSRRLPRLWRRKCWPVPVGWVPGWQRSKGICVGTQSSHTPQRLLTSLHVYRVTPHPVLGVSQRLRVLSVSRCWHKLAHVSSLSSCGFLLQMLPLC